MGEQEVQVQNLKVWIIKDTVKKTEIKMLETEFLS